MSKSRGKSIPESLRNELDSTNKKRDNRVIFLLTVDGEGFPHVALLSPFQVLVMNSCEVLFAVHSSSGTASYLTSRGRCTLIFQSSPSIIYVKVESSAVKDAIELEGAYSDLVFEGEVLEVLEDYSDKAPLISDLKFRVEDVSQWYEAEFRKLSILAESLK